MSSALPPALANAVLAALAAAGDPGPLTGARSLGGGCINHAQRLDTPLGAYVLKWNPAPLPGLFQVEARGLALMAATRSVRVPAVYAAAEAVPGCPAFILQEYLQDETGRPDQAALGEALAAMHRQGSAAAYGLDHHNYIGATPQVNTWETSWPVFFAQHRLRPQLELAARQGRLPGARRARLETLIQRLPELLAGVERRPALLHGDLWGGNVIPGPGGVPALIDPAVYYGDREAELAFTQLFGGFSNRFYQAYQSAWPLDPGFSARRDLYNLYHLLNHLNLFGEGYGAQVDEILRYYAA